MTAWQSVTPAEPQPEQMWERILSFRPSGNTSDPFSGSWYSLLIETPHRALLAFRDLFGSQAVAALLTLDLLGLPNASPDLETLD